MSTFPSVLTSYTNPLSTNRLNAPSHSGIETAQNGGLSQVEAVIGVAGANSVVGTFEYDVRSPASGGGGHVQTANKGGTGQTIYTKGDLLVAQSSSVLNKLNVGNDGQILSANSSTATGTQWINNVLPKISTNASVITITTNAETSIVNATIPGSTLGTSNAIRVTAQITRWEALGSIIARAVYAGNVVASVAFNPEGSEATTYNNFPLAGTAQFTLLANNSATAQRGFIAINVAGGSGRTASVISYFGTGTSSVNSSASQTMGITTVEPTARNLQIGGYIVEKIS